jgi:GDPmannose 4,6-dehydratase
MQWMMLQQEQAEDFVIASGVQYSVRDFLQRAAAELGMTLEFRGEGVNEVGLVTEVRGDRSNRRVGDVIVRVDPRYFRPAEVETLLGDPSKAKTKLGWEPTTTFDELVKEMVESDYSSAKRYSLVKLAGFPVFDYRD